ncbi:hypothetical protein CR513_27762, partial [Mucuna pruriens]
MTFQKGIELITLQGIHLKTLQRAASLKSFVGSTVYHIHELFWSMEGHVSVKQYCYLHHHKDEIEWQAAELLQLRFIRPSNSAFWSLVILVTKKNNS